MTAQIPLINKPTTGPFNDLDQIKLNVGTSNIRNAAIAGMLTK